MRNIFLISACAALFAVASCKKEYTCVCTGIPDTDDRSVALGKSTKGTAKDACELYREEHFSSNLYKAVTCEIK